MRINDTLLQDKSIKNQQWKDKKVRRERAFNKLTNEANKTVNLWTNKKEFVAFQPTEMLDEFFGTAPVSPRNKGPLS